MTTRIQPSFNRLNNTHIEQQKRVGGKETLRVLKQTLIKPTRLADVPWPRAMKSVRIEFKIISVGKFNQCVNNYDDELITKRRFKNMCYNR
jgi:hypothetical protein